MQVWSRDSNSSLCAAGGGLWPTLEAFVTFLVTNIVAHAATIHLPVGVDTVTNVQAVLAAIFMPVFAGDRAFNSINRWFARLFKKQMAFKDIFGGGTFEDAAVSGVVAISVPLRFAPLVARRWDTATTSQNITMLDNKLYWPPSTTTAPVLPFKVSGKLEQYVPFILPPTTKFPGYANYRLSPTSSWLPQIVGIVQAVLSSRQLFVNYTSSVVADGLSSPYLIVLPYIFMSIVNMISNTLVNSYLQVTMLPMAQDALPPDNIVLITECDEASQPYSLRVFAIRKKEPSGISTSQKVPEGSKAGQSVGSSQLPENIELEG
jgi:hypothetical protein